MNRPFRSIQNGKVIYTVARPTGRALERALAQAARENRQVEMDRLSESTAAFTARMFVAAVIRRRANDREVSRARSIIEVAHRWRTALGQSLDGPVAFHLGKKLLKEQIDHDLSMQVVGRKSNENRDEAMTQLLALLEPAKRVSVHADLLSYVHDLAAMARMVAPSYADGAQLTREVLQALGASEISPDRTERVHVPWSGQRAGSVLRLDRVWLRHKLDELRMSTFRLPARPEMTVEHCTGLLMGCMERFVINKDHDSLREFHQLGIPLDFALDCAVKKGNMPTTEFMLYELGVQPSDQTLLNAMRRGQTLRTMFLSSVQPTVRHLNAAVLAEHYDTVDDLIDRFGIKPDHYSVSMMKEGEVSPERTAYVNRLITLLPDQDLKREEVMRNLAAYTTPVQYERAIERLGPLPQRSKNKLLTDCLRAAAPAQARVTIQHGAIFEPNHLGIVGEGLFKKSHTNPKGEWYPVLDTVIEIAIEQDALFEHSDDAESLCRQLVMRHQFAQSEIQPILDRVSLIARACRPVIRPYVGRTLMELVNLRVTPRTQPEMCARLDAFRDHARQVFGVEPHLLGLEAAPPPGM